MEQFQEKHKSQSKIESIGDMKVCLEKPNVSQEIFYLTEWDSSRTGLNTEERVQGSFLKNIFFVSNRHVR